MQLTSRQGGAVPQDRGHRPDADEVPGGLRQRLAGALSRVLPAPQRDVPHVCQRLLVWQDDLRARRSGMRAIGIIYNRKWPLLCVRHQWHVSGT